MRKSNMPTVRIALAHLRFPPTPDKSIDLAKQAIAEATTRQANIICFPEAYIPGYRSATKHLPPPNQAFLDQAWREIAEATTIPVILSTERIIDNKPVLTAKVINADGTTAGFQDKVQIDPSEEATYAPGAARHIFQAGPLTFGIVICHEGWRYPETVRWAARRGAHIVFHPQFHEAGPDSASSFHQKAVFCRAAENTIYFATVNYASPGAPTTTAIANPNGALLAEQPCEKEGLLIADIDLTAATGLLANRYKPITD